MSSPAQLENAWLAEIEFAERPSWAGGDLWYELTDDFDVVDLEVTDDGTFRVRGDVRLSMKWFADDDESVDATNWPFDLTMTISGQFVFVPGREERFVRAWLQYNGAYLLWPYARAYIAALTSLGRFQRLTIYTRQVPQVPDLDSEEDVRPAAPAEPPR